MKPPFGRRTGDSSQEEDNAGKIPMEKWLGQEPQVQSPHAPAECFLRCQCISLFWQQSAARYLDSPELAERSVKPASIQSSNAALACTGHTALSTMLDTITAVQFHAICKPLMFLKCSSRVYFCPSMELSADLPCDGAGPAAWRDAGIGISQRPCWKMTMQSTCPDSHKNSKGGLCSTLMCNKAEGQAVLDSICLCRTCLKWVRYCPLPLMSKGTRRRTLPSSTGLRMTAMRRT
jgi:hypothetical protein